MQKGRYNKEKPDFARRKIVIPDKEKLVNEERKKNEQKLDYAERKEVIVSKEYVVFAQLKKMSLGKQKHLSRDGCKS
jgi:hypothetical protein